MSDHRAYETPATYGDCPPEDEACPHVGCRHNTYLDIQRGKVRVNSPLPPGHPDLAPCCALRYAERGGMQLEEVADVLRLTHRGIQEIERAAFRKFKRALRELRKGSK